MNYDGGKGNIYQRLINLMPPHRVYAELFAGGGAVLRNKRPAQLNIALDLDETAVGDLAYLVASSEMASAAPIAQSGDGRRHVSSVPAVMANIAECGDDAGGFWFPVLEVVLAGIAQNGDVAPSPDVPMVDRRYAFGVVDALAWLRSVELGSDALIYIDPPYLGYVRSSQRPLYQYEMMSEEEHIDLLTILLSLDCMVMISGYWSDLYGDLLHDWRLAEIPTYTRSGRAVTECVWMNYPEPQELHDYSFLGDDFRERERIKRKRSRMVRKLRGLPTLEYAALMRELAV